MANKYSDKNPAPTPPARRSVPPFEALRAFDAVARLGGVRKAARELMRNHAVVSRHIRTLEDWTGTKLVKRTPGGATLTAEGRKYHEKIAVAIDAIANATIDLMKRGDNSCIDIWCIQGLAVRWLMARLSSFESANPDIAIALRPTDEVPDFDRQEADIDIRLDPVYRDSLELTSTVRSVELARPATIAVASPEYLSRNPSIETAKDLLRHQLIHEESFDTWIEWLKAHGLEGEFDLTGLRLFNGHMTLDAASRGRGIALTNQYVVNEDLKAGKLIEVQGASQPFERLSMGSYLFVARRDRWNVRPIRRFREWLQAEMSKDPPLNH